RRIFGILGHQKSSETGAIKTQMVSRMDAVYDVGSYILPLSVRLLIVRSGAFDTKLMIYFSDHFMSKLFFTSRGYQPLSKPLFLEGRELEFRS
ncbi:hypothetical protein L9F63_001513, partial [Diploptera punctata]